MASKPYLRHEPTGRYGVDGGYVASSESSGKRIFEILGRTESGMVNLTGETDYVDSEDLVEVSQKEVENQLLGN